MLGAGRNRSQIQTCLVRFDWKSPRISDNLPAEPGLCLSWQPSRLHGLSRDPTEVRVHWGSQVRPGKTKGSTSCITHWQIMHMERKRMDIWYFGIWSSLEPTHFLSPRHESKTGKTIEWREFWSLYCQGCFGHLSMDKCMQVIYLNWIILVTLVTFV